MRDPRYASFFIEGGRKAKKSRYITVREGKRHSGNRTPKKKHARRNWRTQKGKGQKTRTIRDKQKEQHQHVHRKPAYPGGEGEEITKGDKVTKESGKRQGKRDSKCEADSG